METIKIPEGAQVKLTVLISSDAIVGTGVRIEGNIPVTYPDNQFIHDLGDISMLENKKLTVQSNFHALQNIDQIMEVTQVVLEISYNGKKQKLKVTKQKIFSQLFIAYANVKFIKE